MAPILGAAIVADQDQHATGIASGLLVFAGGMPVVVVVVRALADQTTTHRLPKMDWIRPAWIKNEILSNKVAWIARANIILLFTSFLFLI